MGAHLRQVGTAIKERGLRGGLAAMYPSILASLVIGPFAWLLYPITFAAVPAIGRAADRANTRFRLAAGTHWNQHTRRTAAVIGLAAFFAVAIPAAVMSPAAATVAMALMFGYGTAYLTPSLARRVYLSSQARRPASPARQPGAEGPRSTQSPALGRQTGDLELIGRRVEPSAPKQMELKGRPDFDGLGGSKR